MRCPPGLQQAESHQTEREEDEEDSMEMPTPSPQIRAEDILSRRRRCSSMRCPPGLQEEPTHNEWDEPTGFNDAVPNPVEDAVDHGSEGSAKMPSSTSSDRETDALLV